MDAADELLQTKLTRRPTPRKTTYLGPPPPHPSMPSRRGGGRHGGVPMPTRPAPAVPLAAAADENERGCRRGSGPRLDGDDGTEQASRIWAKIRRCSGLSLADRTNMSMGEEQQSLAAKRGVPKAGPGGKTRRGSGRWGFGNWWA